MYRVGDSQNKIIYCLLRAAVGAFGLLILLSFAVAYLFFGSEGEGEAESSRLSQVALFVYALALLLPHRWFLSRQLLPVKAVVLAAGGIWMLYTSAAGISAYYDGTKHIAILPVSTAAIVISIVAPATLLMRISRPSSH